MSQTTTEHIAEMFPFEYVCGGYFRKMGVKIGEPAPMLHGMNAIRYLHAAMIGEDPTPFLCAAKEGGE